MAGRQASQAITRYAGIQVQTSALGMQIPVGWGTFRCRCNLVDYFNFKSKPTTAAAAGKGGVTTGYTYSASLVLAICEGPIDHISQVWVNGKQYAFNSNGSGVPNTANTGALAQVGLTLANGAVPQTPWAGLPASHQIGYSGLAIAYAANYPLDSSASTPNHSFEVVRTTGFAVGTTPDADPSLVVADFFANTRTGVPGWQAGLVGSLAQYQSYCLAAGLLVSPIIDQQRSATDFLNELLLATNSTALWSEGLLKFIPYGDMPLTGNGATYTPDNTPVYSLNDDDYIVKSPGDAPISVDIQDQSDAYNVVQLEYLDRSNQYNMAIALASDAANVAQYGMRRKDPDTVHCVCTPSVAAIAAQLWLQRTLYIRAKYKFKLGWMFALLEPGDLLELTDAGLGLAAYMARVIQIDEDEKDGTLEVTCEDYPIGVGGAPLYAMQNTAATPINPAVDPGGVEANLLEWSQDFTQSAWAATNLAVTAAAAPDPLGIGADAQRLTPSTTSGAHGLAQSINAFSDAHYTFTVHLCANGYSKAQLLLANGADSASASVDLIAGAVTGASASGGATLVASSITALYPPTPIAAGSATGTTCTLTVGSTTGLVVGQPLVVAGCTPAAYDGAFTVASLTSTTITYVSGAAPGGAMTGFGAVTGGWYRCLVTATIPASPITASVGVLNNAGLSSFAGDGTSAVLAFGAQIAQGVDARIYADTGAGPEAPLIFNPPIALTPGGVEMWAAVAGGLNWGGCNVLVSYDNTTYEQVGAVNGPARYGSLAASFPAGSDPDTVNTCSVDLSASDGELTSAAQAVADAAGTLCLVDPLLPAQAELISFETATLTAPNRYRLTGYIRRGVENTPIGAHSSGAPFVRLDQAVFQFPYLATQAGQTVFVKFQSFNLWGAATQPLSDCIAYQAVPVPLGARPPSGSAWTAIGTTLSNGGQSIPAIVITGASDNPSAQLIDFEYRPSGTQVWASAGTGNNATTRKEITSVQPGQTYDVSVLYIVGGIPSNREIVATGITVGTVATTPSGGGGGGGGSGTTLLSDSVVGPGKTFACPAGSYTQVNIVLTGAAGAGNGTFGGKGGSSVDFGGGGGGAVVVRNLPVTPGSTVFTYTIAAVGSDSSCTSAGVSLTAHSGTNATSSSSGTGGAATSGNTATGAASVTAYAGHNGGIVDQWTGGGAANLSGVYADNNTDDTPGSLPGQGGAGSWLGVQMGGGANLLIVAVTGGEILTEGGAILTTEGGNDINQG